jgi:hypothetical protein
LGEAVEGSSKDKERRSHPRGVSSEPAEGEYGSLSLNRFKNRSLQFSHPGFPESPGIRTITNHLIKFCNWSGPNYGKFPDESGEIDPSSVVYDSPWA